MYNNNTINRRPARKNRFLSIILRTLSWIYTYGRFAIKRYLRDKCSEYCIGLAMFGITHPHILLALMVLCAIIALIWYFYIQHHSRHGLTS